MVEGYHRHNEHESEQTPGVGDGQGSLACCSPWGHKESDTTEELNSTQLNCITQGTLHSDSVMTYMGEESKTEWIYEYV